MPYILTNKEYQKLNNTFIHDDVIQQYIQNIQIVKLKDPHYYVKDGHLYYKNIRILTSPEIPQVLNKTYENDANLKGKSIVTAYKYLRQQYGNLTRADIQSFLNQQPQYQMTSNFRKVIKRPITAKYSNEIWSVDLLDVEKYSGNNKRRNYIFVCVDVFSRKCWLQPMIHKDAVTAKQCLEHIIERAEISPSCIKCDKGGEFHGEFAEYCQEMNIPIIYSQSHTPTQNAIVERCNKEIRKIMNSFFVAHSSLNWIDHLEEIENAKNTSYVSTVKGIPNTIWTPTKEKVLRVIPETIGKNNPILITRSEILKNAIKAKERYLHLDNFQEGDTVRIRMDALFANQRKEIKAKNSKQLIIKYSPEIFTIYKVIHSKVGHNKYILINSDDYQLGINGKIKYFKADELLPATQEANMDYKKALKMNKLLGNENDVIVD